MRCEQPSSNLAPCSCLPQSKPGRLPRQPQSPIFHSNKAGKERHGTEGTRLKGSWRRKREQKINRVLKKNSLKNKNKIKLQATESFSCDARSGGKTHSDRTNLGSLKRPNIALSIKIVFILFHHKTAFKNTS